MGWEVEWEMAGENGSGCGCVMCGKVWERSGCGKWWVVGGGLGGVMGSGRREWECLWGCNGVVVAVMCLYGREWSVMGKGLRCVGWEWVVGEVWELVWRVVGVVLESCGCVMVEMGWLCGG